jgi:O-acetyl-ADP-ribose deacetylase (regulator of RNase III)
MSPIQIVHGSLFTSRCETLVNTINCVGVMGAGIALEFRLRYPEMFAKYVEHCDSDRIRIGTLWIYKASDRWILNFPTKTHWRYPTKEHYVHTGLEKFMSTYEQQGIVSIAFPLLGAQHGSLDPDHAFRIMESYLKDCTIPVEIFRYDAGAEDEVLESIRQMFAQMSRDEVSQRAQIGPRSVDRVRAALENERISQAIQLVGVQGIGIKTVERLYAFARDDGVQRTFDFVESSDTRPGGDDSD